MEINATVSDKGNKSFDQNKCIIYAKTVVLWFSLKQPKNETKKFMGGQIIIPIFNTT